MSVFHIYGQIQNELVISNKIAMHMMLPVGVHELLIAKGKRAVFEA